MQEVFIKKLTEIAKKFSTMYNDGKPWPVQFVVTTHSSHVANKASFRAMRYFLAVPDGDTGHCQSKIKDLGKGFVKELKEHEEFLHQYMTLTQCDLLFADRAILIEGTTERLLLPKMIEKVDAEADPKKTPLSSQYISVLEVGGAYAHRFFNLLDFLELRTLVITDLDAVKLSDKKRYEACRVSEGTHSSNGCVNEWFKSTGGRAPLGDIVTKTAADKCQGKRRIAFQVPEKVGAATKDPAQDALLKATGRSFEDAFFLANAALFSLKADSADAIEESAWQTAQGVAKTDFAIEYAIEKTDWAVPRYIKEGLSWLTEDEAVCAVAGPGVEPPLTGKSNE